MSTDRELLELAAKAIGIVGDSGIYHEYDRSMRIKRPEGGHEWWSPFDDDGDALRLSVKLDLDIIFYRKHVDVCDNTRTQNVAREDFTSDKNSAARRAITRAAAEIGRAMP